MEIFGITGSIATGKSTVTNYLRDKGYLVVDSDKLAYDALTIDQDCINKTKTRFNLPEGKIDRKKLGKIIFNDKEAKADLEKIEGDTLVCSVDNKEAGYLITSIPYDEGFEIRLNGEKISMEKVNTAFLGAKVPKGRYTVEISYQAPGKKLGVVCTGVGILLLLGGKIRCNKKERMIQY